MIWRDGADWLLICGWISIMVAMAASLVRDDLERRRRQRARHHPPRFGARPRVDDVRRRLNIESSFLSRRPRTPATASGREAEACLGRSDRRLVIKSRRVRRMVMEERS